MLRYWFKGLILVIFQILFILTCSLEVAIIILRKCNYLHGAETESTAAQLQSFSANTVFSC